ncbi:hypothetical protein [Rahnella sp. ChDrAdgB13]|uniref:hypothetical protein n=1 Tax=Rahnella sp. ChDrAdgB13 TaxID=1850581 RepID=UPI001AD885B4|nr:hypothetical protein [Rahnella sp. ChDrAdgB13]
MKLSIEKLKDLRANISWLNSEIPELREFAEEQAAAFDELIAIREAKGEQVPFAFAYRYAGCETTSGFEDWRNELSRERPADWMIETGKVTGLIELFTTPVFPVVPEGWQLVPIEPTESMVIDGFESKPDESFSPRDVWEEYDAMSGCAQAAHRAKLCWAAMLAAAPKFGDEPDNQN